jgi:hypothetical protein
MLLHTGYARGGRKLTVLKEHLCAGLTWIISLRLGIHTHGAAWIQILRAVGWFECSMTCLTSAKQQTLPRLRKQTLIACTRCKAAGNRHARFLTAFVRHTDYTAYLSKQIASAPNLLLFCTCHDCSFIAHAHGQQWHDVLELRQQGKWDAHSIKGCGRSAAVRDSICLYAFRYPWITLAEMSHQSPARHGIPRW